MLPLPLGLCLRRYFYHGILGSPKTFLKVSLKPPYYDKVICLFVSCFTICKCVLNICHVLLSPVSKCRYLTSSWYISVLVRRLMTSNMSMLSMIFYPPYHEKSRPIFILFMCVYIGLSGLYVSVISSFSVLISIMLGFL